MSTRIGFSTSKTSWISCIIRWFTRSTVSHCFLVYYDAEWKRDMIMESEGGLGGSVRIVRFNPDNPDIVNLFTPRHDIEHGMQQMAEKLGELYDYGGLFGMAWVMVGRWLKRKWKNPWNSSKALWCSELVAEVMKDSGYPGSGVFEDATVTSPEDLYEFFLQEQAEPPMPSQ